MAVLHKQYQIRITSSPTFFDPDRRRFEYSMPSLILIFFFVLLTEAVAGIVGRADILAAIFFLLALLAFNKHMQIRDKK